MLLEKHIKCIYDKSQKEEITPGVVIITSGALSAGFESFDFNIIAISLAEVFTPSKPKRVINNTTFKQGEMINFSDLKPR